VLLLVAPFLGESIFIEYRRMHPKKEVQRRGGKGRRGGDEEEKESLPAFVVNTLRDALTRKSR
jgi:hypothetical protein